MIDRNHPAVEAANEGVQEWLAGDGPFDDDPVRLASDMTAVCINAALPLLESATEDNLARLRGTPAGKQLLAEGWDERHKARPDYSQGRDDDCMGWEDCHCGRYVNPYRD